MYSLYFFGTCLAEVSYGTPADRFFEVAEETGGEGGGNPLQVLEASGLRGVFVLTLSPKPENPKPKTLNPKP